MFTTLVGVLTAIAVLLPGFVVAELAKIGRARAEETDLELALRALLFALILHVALAPWTRDVIGRVDNPNGWSEHLGAAVLYVGIGLIALPVAAGLGLNAYLRNAEAREPKLKLRHRVLGGRDARDSWDYLFQRLTPNGGWLIVELRPETGSGPLLVGGKYGNASSVGQSPCEHNLYLQEMWTVSAEFPRNLVEPVRPQRGTWIPAAEIVRVEVLNPPDAEVHSVP